ncbi:MAG: hypothetical protein NC548_39245 [Lachnospiraceae bacterium]|nr:hypothetical protein [Lachnospiraceae bacterium]
MEKSMDDLYRELIENASGGFGNPGDFNSILSPGGRRYVMPGDDEEVEAFITSEDIEKAKEKEEDNPYRQIQRTEGGIEEDVHFKRFTKRRQHKYTETEMKEIRASCVRTIVHDYGENDIYHLSDEERAKNDMLAELRVKLGGLKSTYRQIDKYIEAMRVVVAAWELLEKNGNYLHTEKEFFQMVARGEIFSTSILMPKMKKIDRYNIETLITYISNPELDPKDLLPKEVKDHDDFYDEDGAVDEYGEDEATSLARYLSPEEVKWLEEHIDNPPEYKVKDIDPKLIRGYDKYGISSISGLSSRKKKKKSKKKRYQIESLHDILNVIQANPSNRSDRGYAQSYGITHGMFETEKPETNWLDEIPFEGSWASELDVYLYDLMLREEMLKRHPDNEKYLTYADKELAQFFKILEDNGVNVIELRRRMECTDEDVSRRINSKVRKSNKKLESAILQRITELNKSDKFKKLVTKAEEAINRQYGEQ